ncbi:helix-turn-helix domain-containing protein [Leucobacter sp. HY1908]
MAALAAAVERDIEALAVNRFVSPFAAALMVGRHVETVRDALRSGELHGVQRVKGGAWRLRPACVEAWADGVPCAHQEERRPVSLQEWRTRPARGSL